jgi:protein SCO1
MHKLIGLFLIVVLFFGCKKDNHREVDLPYYQSADFTPIWLNLGANKNKLHSLPSFEFTNQYNQKISDQSLKGKIHVMNCFFTICPSMCPRIMQNMQAVQTTFHDDNDVLIVSYSVMPEHDSVSVLKRYAKGNHIGSKWHLLTGEKSKIYNLARKGYFADENLGVQKGENDFLHTENFILVDKNLHIRGIYNGTLPLEIDALIQDIKMLNK